MVFQSSPSMAKGMVGMVQGGTKGLEMSSNPLLPLHGAGKKILKVLGMVVERERTCSCQDWEFETKNGEIQLDIGKEFGYGDGW